jgi:predicted dehydrogenase
MKILKVMNIGILGVSSFAMKSMVPAILSLSNLFKLNSIATRDIKKINKLILPKEIKIYLDYEELIQDKNIDIIYIPLPNSLHFEYAKKSLLNNKHVIVEKSLACKLEHVTELTQLAEQLNLSLLENFLFLHHSQFSYIKRLIKSNEIGELRYIRSNFSFPPFEDENNIRYNKDLGGGALLDAGVYPLKIIPQFLGYDIDINDAHMLYDNSKEVDILGYGTLTPIYGSAFAHFFYGFDSYYQCNIEILGTKGKISTNRIFTAPYDFIPKVLIEKDGSSQLIDLPKDNQFINSLIYFHSLLNDRDSRSREFANIINHANLIDNFFKLSKFRGF